jgi:hypothetical protein
MRQGGGILPSPLAHLAPPCRLGGHRFVHRHGNGMNICSILRRQPLPALTALIASATWWVPVARCEIHTLVLEGMLD